MHDPDIIDQETAEKMQFVEELENTVILASKLTVKNLEYRRQGSYETVTINFENGYAKHVNVSCDSLTAIALDVLAAL